MNQNNDYDDPYQILGITPKDAEPEILKSIIRKAAYETSQKCSIQSKEQEECREAADQFARMNQAYQQILADNNNASQVQQQNGGDDRRLLLDRDLFHRRSGDPFSQHRRRRNQNSESDDDAMVNPFDRFLSGPGGLFGGDRMIEDAFEEMRRMQQDGGGSNGFFSSSSTSSTSYAGKNGEQITEVTTTRRVNGKEQTVKERIIRKSDGTVERETETSGEASLPSLQQQEEHPIERFRSSSSRREPAPKPPQQKDPWSRRFGMTPEQRAQLNDDDDDDDVPKTSSMPSQDKATAPKAKKAWSFW